MLPQPPLWLILIAFVCALGPLVFFHELGHYLVARLFRFRAEVFSIGFGREIVGWTDKQGTRWKVGWLPLGGYVRFVGDMSPASNPAELDTSAGASRPGVPAAAGVAAFPGRPRRAGGQFPAGDRDLRGLFLACRNAARQRRRRRRPEIAPAAALGSRPGDRIVSVAGRATPTFDDVANVVLLRPNETVPIEIERGGQSQELTVELGARNNRSDGPENARRGRSAFTRRPRSASRFRSTKPCPWRSTRPCE